MKIDYSWKASSKTFNPNNLDNTDNETIESSYKNMKFLTKPIDIFINWTLKDFNNQVREQQEFIKKQTNIYLKYKKINETFANKLIDIYDKYFYFKWYYYDIFAVSENLHSEIVKENVLYTKPTEEDIDRANAEAEKKVIKIKVNKQVIRWITWYSHIVKMPWHTEPISIDWQKLLLEDNAKIIAVDGSRQIWKSKSIAQKMIEHSFLGNQQILVAGFIKKTTDVIRNYANQYIKKFDEWVFEYKASLNCLINHQSWSMIYFRTLDDWGASIRWMTLNLIIIDEAQLISEDIFLEVLEPTLTTTDWQMIVIWTPWPTWKWYFYKLIQTWSRRIKEWEPSIMLRWTENPYLSYYRISILENPLVAPRIKASIMEKRNNPSIRKEYFNDWHSGEDQLFQAKETINYPTNLVNWTYVITFDPARTWKDWSAFAITYVFNWHTYWVFSWNVPAQYKRKWGQQMKWIYSNVVKKYMDNDVYYWVDLRWLWEWFKEAWDTFYKKKLEDWEIKQRPNLITITYTSWSNITNNITEIKVSKSILIDKLEDAIMEDKISFIKINNTDFFEEILFIFWWEDSYWNKKIIWSPKDDITNAYMTCNLLIDLKSIRRRIHLENKEDSSNEADISKWFADDFKARNPNYKPKTSWLMTELI